MKRAQGTFEYVLLLGGVLLIVVIAMVTLTGSLPTLDSGSACAVQARSAVSCFGADGAFHPEQSFTFQEQATPCGCGAVGGSFELQFSGGSGQASAEFPTGSASLDSENTLFFAETARQYSFEPAPEALARFPDRIVATWRNSAPSGGTFIVRVSVTRPLDDIARQQIDASKTLVPSLSQLADQSGVAGQVTTTFALSGGITLRGFWAGSDSDPYQLVFAFSPQNDVAGALSLSLFVPEIPASQLSVVPVSRRENGAFVWDEAHVPAGDAFEARVSVPKPSVSLQDFVTQIRDANPLLSFQTALASPLPSPSPSPSPSTFPSVSPSPLPSPSPSPSAGPVCGDGLCQSDESSAVCPVDCGGPFVSPSPSPSPAPGIFSFETRSDGAVRVSNPSGTQSDQNPAFLDETRLLFTRFADGYNAGLATLVLLDLRDGSETVVVSDGGVAVSTSGNPFTPDRQNVCYSSDTQSEDDVWCAPLSGGTAARITLDESGAHFIEPSVRSDGQRIAFEKHAAGLIDASKGEIWTTDLAGNVLVLLADAADNRLPQYHPSENKVLIQRGVNGVFRLAVVDGQSGAVTDAGIQTDEGTDASWTESGGIVYSGEGAELAVPGIFLLQNGQSLRVTDSAMLDSAPGAALDGSQIAFESRVSEGAPARIWLKAAPMLEPAATDFTLAKGLTFSWQLVEPVDASIAADVYDIDLFNNDASVVQALHDQGRKVICYVSVGSWESFREDAAAFPAEAIGNTYEPPFEDEKWLDIRHVGVRDIMKTRLDSCKQKGFDGVEPDNINGYLENTGFPLTAEDQLDFNRFLASEAHARGLSIG
ncbi:MAG: endo alpha-1,4 polygalactosaminidase, partial [Candidatus Micrarchaeota archaeon]|nr:endo alpha-1,4 polygalactosaminidase [Candidatus Micrarchaeota archaeon]